MGQYGQVIVNTPEELQEVIDDSNGKTSVYFSHNSYPGSERKCEWTPPGKYCCHKCRIDNVENVRISQVYFDFDHNTKLENALADARKFKFWVNKEGLPYAIAFSGKKGFQFCIKLNPAVYSLTEKIYLNSDIKVTLSDYYKSLQVTLKQRLDLKTLDLKCAEPKRIMRYWNTQHFNKHGKKTGTYCVPMTPQMLDTMNPSQIVEYASQPREINILMWNQGRRQLTFEDFIDEYEISPKVIMIDNWEPGSVMIADYEFGHEEKDTPAKTWFRAMMPDICVCQAMWPKITKTEEGAIIKHNPTHIARLASGIWWANLWKEAPIIEHDGEKIRIAPSPAWVEQFYRRMEYRDLCLDNDRGAGGKPCGFCNNCRRRQASINSVYHKDYKYPSCATLYAGGICVGEACPKFKRYLKKIADNQTQDKSDTETSKDL